MGKKIWAVISLLLVPLQAHGSAFSIFENGARASGMAGAFVAIANDGSSLFYNPAGIAFQKGMRLQMDNLGVAGLFRFFPSDTPPGTIVPEKGFNLSTRPHLITVGSMYLSKDISSKWTAGFGMFAPFGLAANATSFNDSDPPHLKYVGRYAGTRARLESIWFQPTAAYRLTANSSVAFGVALVHTHLLIEQSILNPLDDGAEFGEEVASIIFPGQDKTKAARSIARLLPEGRSRLAGTSQSPGYNVGYLYKHPGSKSSVGFQFRSKVTHKLDGRASFAFTTGYALEQFVGKETIPELFPAQDIKGKFVTPATYSMGFANSCWWNSTIAVQLDIQDYSKFKDVPVNFTNTVDTATPEELILPFDFEPSYIVRLGFEKALGDKMTVRAGYSFDHSPVKDASVGPLFPDSDRNSFTFGASRRFGNKEFSFFYHAMNFTERTTNVAENNNQFTNGEYRNFAHLMGFGLRIHIGAGNNPFDR